MSKILGPQADRNFALSWRHAKAPPAEHKRFPEANLHELQVERKECMAPYIRWFFAANSSIYLRKSHVLSGRSYLLSSCVSFRLLCSELVYSQMRFGNDQKRI